MNNKRNANKILSKKAQKRVKGGNGIYNGIYNGLVKESRESGEGGHDLKGTAARWGEYIKGS